MPLFERHANKIQLNDSGLLLLQRKHITVAEIIQGKYNGKLFVIKAARDKALNHVGTAEFHKVNGCHK